MYGCRQARRATCARFLRIGQCRSAMAFGTDIRQQRWQYRLAAALAHLPCLVAHGAHGCVACSPPHSCHHSYPSLIPRTHAIWQNPALPTMQRYATHMAMRHGYCRSFRPDTRVIRLCLKRQLAQGMCQAQVLPGFALGRGGAQQVRGWKSHHHGRSGQSSQRSPAARGLCRIVIHARTILVRAGGCFGPAHAVCLSTQLPQRRTASQHAVRSMPPHAQQQMRLQAQHFLPQAGAPRRQLCLAQHLPRRNHALRCTHVMHPIRLQPHSRNHVHEQAPHIGLRPLLCCRQLFKARGVKHQQPARCSNRLAA